MVTQPRVRRVEIVAQDPSIRDRAGNIVIATVSIPFEHLERGPQGFAVQVVDYDASSQTMYEPAEVPDDELLKAPPSAEILGNPKFHAINAYALVMRTLHRFEFALGRRVGWSTGGHQLKVVPHAFEQANAFYAEDAEALVFGYVRSRGALTLFGLSHDVIVHETSHALIDGIRDNFTKPSSPDQAALHEGLADVVALLSVFSLKDVLEPFIDEIPGQAGRRRRGPTSLLTKDDVTKDRLKQSVLLGLADEMRSESGDARVNALRRSVLIDPSTTILERIEFEEPHRRGEVLVAAVLNAFLDTWVARIQDPGMSPLPTVSRTRVAEEGAAIADVLLTMAIRALDYTPPIHIEFGDYLSALITGDVEVRSDDSRYDLRSRLLSSFKAYGIEPASGTPDGTWQRPSLKLRRDGAHFGSLQTDPTEVFRLVWSNREPLRIDPEAFTRITSVRPSFRVSPDDGFQVRETVIECTQYLKVPAPELGEYHLQRPDGMEDDFEVVLRGGSTLVLDEYGELKYVVYQPIPTRGRTSPDRRARNQRRLDYLWQGGFLDAGASLTQNLASLHRRRAMGAGAASPPGQPTVREESWT